MHVVERRVLDALPFTVYTVDLEGRIASVNQPSSRLVPDDGATHAGGGRDLRGRSIWDALPGGASREQVQSAMQILRTGRAPVVHWEFSGDAPDEERTILLHVAPLHDEDRTVSGFVVSTLDITPSHQARQALIDAGIALSRTIDLDRAFQELAQQVRRAFRAEALVVALAEDESAMLDIAYQFGYDGDPRALAERLSPVWRDGVARGHVVTRTSAQGIELTAPLVGSNGSLGAMTLLVEPMQSPQHVGEAQHLLGILAAQTATAIERARLVRRAAHRHRLETAGEVAAGVARELRNPLFGISSAAQLLRFRAREDPVVEKNVGRILREVEHLNRMATSLLDYARPSTLTLASADPDGVWDAVLEAQRGRLESRALALHRTRVAPAVKIPIDAEKLTRVFGDVLANAVDAAPEASDLSLVSTVLPSGSWRCRIQNTGAAIPPEMLPRVFEIFFSTKPGGTGLGLALCQRIVEEHHGTIGIESSAESGTAVTIVLPAAAS